MLEGLHPNRPTHVMRLASDEASALAMVTLLGEVFDPAETAVATFETEDNGPWLLEAYFSHEPNRAAICDLLRPIVGDVVDEAEFSEIDQKDWVKASLDGLKPVRAGRILVHGSHDRHQRRINDTAIEIEAALAFGTGHHGTTLGCLRAFIDELKRRTPRRILDVGTGTGILGFAAAKLLRTKVVAGDIDPVAVLVAKDNARLNGIGGLMEFYTAPGVRGRLADRANHFDLVFANILAKPLRLLARDLTHVTANDGTLILSGLLKQDVPGILSAYGTQGWRLNRRYDLDGWVALAMRKGGAAARPVSGQA